MVNFTTHDINFGAVEVGSVTTIKFPKTPNADKIISMSAQCGCTQPVEYPDYVEVKYHAGALPLGKVANGTSKRITVSFKAADNSAYADQLTITGVIVKPGYK